MFCRVKNIAFTQRRVYRQRAAAAAVGNIFSLSQLQQRHSHRVTIAAFIERFLRGSEAVPAEARPSFPLSLSLFFPFFISPASGSYNPWFCH